MKKTRYVSHFLGVGGGGGIGFSSSFKLLWNLSIVILVRCNCMILSSQLVTAILLVPVTTSVTLRLDSVCVSPMLKGVPVSSVNQVSMVSHIVVPVSVTEMQTHVRI